MSALECASGTAFSCALAAAVPVSQMLPPSTVTPTARRIHGCT